MPPKKQVTKPNAKPTDGPAGLNQVTDISKFRTETLTGDVRDMILQQYRDAKNGLPWTVRSEADQQKVIDQVTSFSESLVARVINLVAAKGEKSLPVQIGPWTVDKGLKIKVTAAEIAENISMLTGAAVGHLVLSSVSDFQGERAPMRASPDQRRMFDEDSNPGAKPRGRGRPRKDLDGPDEPINPDPNP